MLVFAVGATFSIGRCSSARRGSAVVVPYNSPNGPTPDPTDISDRYGALVPGRASQRGMGLVRMENVSLFHGRNQ